MSALLLALATLWGLPPVAEALAAAARGGKETGPGHQERQSACMEMAFLTKKKKSKLHPFSRLGDVFELLLGQAELSPKYPVPADPSRQSGLRILHGRLGLTKAKDKSAPTALIYGGTEQELILLIHFSTCQIIAAKDK
ncbi:hypothetical protein BTVI_83951 [Pitangus sulphuratus]|nr:hypothetical protein BTVI_83951 [Pitangus sulphuratus]